MEKDLFRIYFVSEEDSYDPKRECRAWKWESDYLPSQTLMDAFEHASFPKKEARFVNLFCDGGLQKEAIRRVRSSQKPVIAMGDKVERILNRFGISHLAMMHPNRCSESMFNRHIEHLIKHSKELHGQDVLPVSKIEAADNKKNVQDHNQ